MITQLVHQRATVSGLCLKIVAFFGLAALAFAQPRPLDNIASRQYQHEIRPLRIALDRWLHELGLQEAGLSIRLVKADDLPPNSCRMSNFDMRSLIGEIDVLRSDEYVVHGHDLEVESLKSKKGTRLMAYRPACLLVKRPQRSPFICFASFSFSAQKFSRMSVSGCNSSTKWILNG